MLKIMKTDSKTEPKEFPVLGPGSVEAEQVGVAVRMQDPTGKKYIEFHRNCSADAARPIRRARLRLPKRWAWT